MYMRSKGILPCSYLFLLFLITSYITILYKMQMSTCY